MSVYKYDPESISKNQKAALEAILKSDEAQYLRSVAELKNAVGGNSSEYQMQPIVQALIGTKLSKYAFMEIMSSSAFEESYMSRAVELGDNTVVQQFCNSGMRNNADLVAKLFKQALYLEARDRDHKVAGPRRSSIVDSFAKSIAIRLTIVGRPDINECYTLVRDALLPNPCQAPTPKTLLLSQSKEQSTQTAQEEAKQSKRRNSL